VLLCGYPPFYDEGASELISTITKGNFEFHPTDWSDKSAAGVALLFSFLSTFDTANSFVSFPDIDCDDLVIYTYIFFE
jgi:hypothetical protein